MTHQSIDYTATIDGSEYEFEITFGMGWVDNLRDDVVWNVEWWSVTKIDGHPNRLGEFWAERLDEESVCDAIMEAAA